MSFHLTPNNQDYYHLAICELIHCQLSESEFLASQAAKPSAQNYSIYRILIIL